MRKKGKLYTANKWNKSLFADVDRDHQNIFDGFNSSFLNKSGGNQLGAGVLNTMPTLNNSTVVTPYINWGKQGAAEKAINMAKGATEYGTANGGQQKLSGFSMGQVAGSLASVIPNNSFTFNGINYRRGYFDAADPLFQLAGNKKNEVGDTFSDIGVELTKSGLSSGNPWIALGGAAAKIFGDIINAGWGIEEHTDKIKAVEKNTAQNSAAGNAMAGATTNDEVLTQAGNLTGYSGYSWNDLYTPGWFVHDKAKRKGETKLNGEKAALALGTHGLSTGSKNVDYYNDSAIKRAQVSAYGGPLSIIDNDNSMSPVIDYDLATDYLLTKKKQAENKSNNINNPFVGVPSTLFALGGDIQMGGGDYSTGLTHIDAGSSHEMNPNDGVQMGVDNEGIPNLVEEGEVIYDDYVYSQRILCDDSTKKKFHIGKKQDISYADLAKKLEKEIKERPNDPISRAGFEAQMHQLADEQERQKAEMEAKRAKEAFDALSPEEKVALMQRLKEVARANEAAEAGAAPMDENMGVPAQTQPTPEEAAMMQQQQMQGQGIPQTPDVVPNMGAEGGRIVRAGDVDSEENIFAKGGKKSRRRYARRYGKEWFEQQAESLGIPKEYMDRFKYNADDGEANLAAFNNLYREYQKDKAQRTYVDGQRQVKKNELFGPNGLYRKSDDGKKIYERRITQEGDDWVDAEGNTLSQEDYDKLGADEQKAYQRVASRIGDRLIGQNGRFLEQLYAGSEDDLLNQYNDDYTQGFSWNDADAQTLQYPAYMHHSPGSYLRYADLPIQAGTLLHNIISPKDYSSAEGIQRLGNLAPIEIRQNFNPTYLSYRPAETVSGRNRNAALLNSALNSFDNTINPNKEANKQAALYNSLLADGQLGLEAQKYNAAMEQAVAAHNAGENRALAQFDLQEQQANQAAQIQAAQHNARYKALGYQMKDEINERRNAGINASLTGLSNVLTGIGDEIYDEDRLKWLEDTGTLKSDYFNRRRYGKYGGRINKKKGGKC